MFWLLSNMKHILKKDNRYTLILLLGFVAIVFLVLTGALFVSEKLATIDGKLTQAIRANERGGPSIVAYPQMQNELSQQVGSIRTMLFLGFGILIIFSGIIINDAYQNKKNRDELIDQKERAEMLAGAKQQFIANMSHEIKTPLHAIFGITQQVLDDNSIGLMQRELFNKLYNSSKHLLRMIEDVLLLANDDESLPSLHMKPFAPKDVLGEMAEEFSVKAQTKKLDFVFMPNAIQEKMVLGDTVRLQQIVSNLLDNSLKFTEKGRIELSYHMVEKGQGGIELHLKVKDTGVGIAPEHLPFVFDELRQEDGSITKQFGGIGMGLAITKKLVKWQGGHISVDSIKNIYTCFTVVLPFQIAEERGELPVTLESEQKFNKPLSVLVVDDDEFNVMLATAMLKNRNCLVKTAMEGFEASKLLQNFDFDVILLDIHLPKISGVVVAESLRNSKGGKNNATPILAVTATMLTENLLTKFNTVGIDDCLPKPYNETQLWEKINTLVNKDTLKSHQLANHTN